jgi:TetR/AcrR family transcriptional regulator
MPTQTFFNLPEEKRKQITQIAVEEFANHNYDRVSISRIVARAGIAKGSFYQYFSGKEDLYGHLLGLVLEAKTAFMSLEHPDPQKLGIFQYLCWVSKNGVAFQMAYPELTRIGLRSLSSAPQPKAFEALANDASVAFFRRLVEVGQEQGDISPDIDPELAAIVFESVLARVSKLVLHDLSLKAARLGKEPQKVYDIDAVSDVFERAVAILQFGLGRRARSLGEVG